MSIGGAPDRRRDALLRMPLAELASWHLLASCGACRQDRMVSIRSLIEQFGLEVALIRLVPRLRCGMPQCKLPPSRLLLRNRLPVHPGPKLVEVTLMDSRAAAFR